MVRSPYRPRATRIAYNQGEGVFHFEVKQQSDKTEMLFLTLRENRLNGKIACVSLNEQEVTVMISKLFDCLMNLQARRADAAT